MASLIRIGQRESRAAETEVLPDGRKRLTRFFEVATTLQIPPELNLAYGTADFFPDPPSGWTGLLLTNKKLSDDLPKKGTDSRPILQLVFEQISPTGETPVGGVTERVLPDGRVGYDLDYLQFSTNAFVPGVPGTGTAPNDNAAFLLQVEGPDDGTLRRIKRTYVYAGELAIDTQTKNNGALSVVTITAAKTAPTTPSGYTLIGQPIQNPNGLPIYTYTYAKGTGEIDRDTQVKNNGSLQIVVIRYLTVPSTGSQPTSDPLSGGVIFDTQYAQQDGTMLWVVSWAKGSGQVSKQIEYRQSHDQGTNGVTITTFRYLTASTVTTDPTTGPSGSVNIGVTDEDLDGYRIWTSVYANGEGTIFSSVSTRNGGKLIIYKITGLNSAPSAPSATIGGTVTLIDAVQHLGSRFESGVVIYEYTWAEGLGEISREITYLQSINQGTAGITRTVIRYLTASSVASDPTSAPAGAVNVGVDRVDQDGYRIWTSTYAIGAGTVITEKEIRNGGKLVLYRIAALGTAPSAPSATIGGTVTSISTSSRTEAGYVVYDYRWAEGVGEIGREITYLQSINQGTAGVTRTVIRYLTASSVTSDPTTAPSGAVNIGVDRVDQDGYRIWTSTYAIGAGTVTTEKEIRNGGKLILYRIVALGTAPGAPSATIGGTVTSLSTSSRTEAGYVVYDYRWAEGEGLAVDESEVRSGGSLVIYHRLSLGVAPTTPTATIGGTVTSFETLVRQEDGYPIYDYRWAEANGDASVNTRGREDGSLVYTVVELDAALATPAYPGSGTAYLVELDNTGAEGYFINRATYIKPPETLNLKKKVRFLMPGLAFFSGTQLILQPPTEQFLEANVAVSYGTSQVTATLWNVTNYASFSDYYVVSSTKQVVSHTQGLGDYLAGGSTSSGTNSDYQGIPCDAWSYILTGSTPSALPSGATNLDLQNEPYLVDLTGVVVYRSALTTFTF